MPKDVAELCALFDLTATGRLTFRGPQPQTLLQRLFGGQVLGQTLVAAAQTVPRDRLVHSLNAYFLRPGAIDVPLDFDVEVLRDGHTFSNRRVVTRQGDTVIFQMTASFQEPEPGLDHTAAPPSGTAVPDACPSLAEVLERRFGRQITMISEWDALDVRLAAQPREDRQGGSMRAWVRTKQPMPDDPLLHAAVLAYLSDITLLSVTAIPHEVEFLSPRMQAASIDHAMWFHRPVRVDEWLLYDMISPSASSARGFAMGRLFQDGAAVASCAQEGLIRVVGDR
ncbi:MAG: acyl-CoA thioesterase II [Tessaracoccus sp.]|uniref:acyl-CoA thioesterase n=2 Tax=Tessaracoccus sp. TaxID=1971211 RepID=UPI001ED291F2|nr:acyl-CoA thioesterase II [Tessaracoccus sp.]MBK7821367.1 acyl-CoA thioesterase II [Tessaracoccus sp.]